MFECRGCKAKDLELARATEREAALVQFIRELQYALHPARLQNPNASMVTAQHIENKSVASDLGEGCAPRVPRDIPPPPFVRTLQRGGHVLPLSDESLRRAARGEAS
jgi:hypothetical protein